MYESTEAWIDRQDWTPGIRLQAHALHARRVMSGLNPLTLPQWRSWAIARQETDRTARDEHFYS